MSGYSYDGPAGKIGFAPRMTPEHFKCFFSASEAWGSFSQEIKNGTHQVAVCVKWGCLRLEEISLTTSSSRQLAGVDAWLDGKTLDHQVAQAAGRVTVRFRRAVEISAGGALAIELSQ